MHIKDHSAAMKFFRTYDNVASKGKWKEFVNEMEFDSVVQEPRTMAHGGRPGYQGGQLVDHGPGRQGYQGKKDSYPKKKGFVWDLDKKEFREPKISPGRPVKSPYVAQSSNIVKTYKDYVISDFSKGDMSTTKSFSAWVNSKYPKKAGSIKAEIHKQGLLSGKFEVQKKKELVKELISQANEGEKFVEIQAISKKLGKYNTLTDLGWLDKKDVVDFDGNPLETREQKVSKVFDNIRKENSSLSLSQKPAAGLKHNGIITQLIGERAGVNTNWVIRRGLKQNDWYNKHVKSMQYLRGYHAEDFIDMPFNEAFKYADERQGHRVTFKGKELRMFKDPNHNIMGWALRSWDGNNFAGKKTLEEGNRIQFFDNKGKPITWKKDLKLNMGDVSFTYDGKPMGWDLKTLKTHGPKSGLFNEAYDATKNYFTTMNKEVLYKGKTMPFREVMEKVYGDKPISIGHEGIGGVRGEPFKKFKIMTQSMNSALGSVMKSIPQKSLRKKMINEIFGDLKSFKGQAWTDAMVNLEVKKAGQTIKGGLTPYVQAAKNIIEQEGPKLPEPAVQKLGNILKRAEVKTITKNWGDKVNSAKAQTLAKALELKGIKICQKGIVEKGSGGRIGFAGKCGVALAADNPNLFMKMAQNSKEAMNLFASGKIKPFLMQAKNWAGKNMGPAGWIGGELLVIGLGGAYEMTQGKGWKEALDTWTGLGGHFGMSEKRLKEIGKEQGWSEQQVYDAMKFQKLLALSQEGEEKEAELEDFLERQDIGGTARFKSSDVPSVTQNMTGAIFGEGEEPSYPDYSGTRNIGERGYIRDKYQDPKFLRNLKKEVPEIWKEGEDLYKTLMRPQSSATLLQELQDRKKYEELEEKKKIWEALQKRPGIGQQLEAPDPSDLGPFERSPGHPGYTGAFTNWTPYAGGGRVSFKGGGIDKGRRAVLKLLAALGIGTATVGTGLIKLGGKAVGKKAAVQAGVDIATSTPGMPSWFPALVNKIVKEGDDVTAKLATQERQLVHTKKLPDGEEVTVYRDIDTGDIRVDYDSVYNMGEGTAPVSLEYKAGQVIDEGTMKGKKTDAEFSAQEVEPVSYTQGPDDFSIEWDGSNVVGSVDDLVSDTSKLKNYAKGEKSTMKDIVTRKRKRDEVDAIHKNESDYISSKQGEGDAGDYDYASGGRVSYFDGGIVSLKKKW